MPERSRFDSAAPFYRATQPITIKGKTYVRGDLIPAGAIEARRMMLLHEQRRVDPCYDAPRKKKSAVTIEA